MQLSRRDVLRSGLGGLGAIGLAGAVPAALASSFAGGVPGTRLSGEKILIVVQLSGGNDGLNTVIPAGHDAYLRARPTLALTRDLHRLDDHLALHPALRPFKELFDAGNLAVINGCGYPCPQRSHFAAMEVWHTARLGEPQPTGWLGRYLDSLPRDARYPLRAINIGPELPQALVSDHEPVPSIQSIDDLQVRAGAISRPDAIRARVAGYEPHADYPAGGLGAPLRLIAQLIAGELGTGVFYCQVSGFDTHANQLGQHARLLDNVAASVHAFHRDMRAKGCGDKVVTVCFSEFGRSLSENGSAGTDHGAAGPMFVVGDAVRGGLYGRYPSLTDLDDNDDVYSTDFRRVYATLLDQWLDADSAVVLKNRFEPLSFL